MSEKKGLGIFCGLCDKYYPDIQKVEEHKVHTLSDFHWKEVRKFIESEALSAQLATIATAVGEMQRYGSGIAIGGRYKGEWQIQLQSNGRYLDRAEVLQAIKEVGK